MPKPIGPPEQQPKTFRQSASLWVNCIIGIAQDIAMVPELLLRQIGTSGSKFFGSVQPAIGIGIMFLWIANYHPGHAVLAFWIAIAVQIAQRLGGIWRHPATHSRHGGESIFPGDEFAAKGLWEPLATFLGGWMLCSVSPGAGSFFMIASGALVISYISARAELDAQARAITDARADQYIVREHYRETQQ